MTMVKRIEAYHPEEVHQVSILSDVDATLSLCQDTVGLHL